MPNIAIIGAVQGTEVAILAAARTQRWTVSAICTLPPDRSARHSDYVDLSATAEQVGADLIHAPRINDPAVVERLAAAKPDILFVAGWSQICGPEILNICPDRMLGYHPAALPRLRGRAAIPWTILNEEPITAGTLFWVDEGVDSGPIVEQQFFHVARDETAASLYGKHMEALDAMVFRALNRLADGHDPGRVQDDRYATYATRRTADDGLIDWSLPTAGIDRLIRAVGDPYPGAFTHVGEAPLHIWTAAPEPGADRHVAMPGQVVSRDAESFCVKTVDGLLRVTSWTSASGEAPKQHSLLGRRTA